MYYHDNGNSYFNIETDRIYVKDQSLFMLNQNLELGFKLFFTKVMKDFFDVI